MNTLDATQASSTLITITQPLSALGYILPDTADLSLAACDERCRVLRQFVERATASLWRERAAIKLRAANPYPDGNPLRGSVIRCPQCGYPEVEGVNYKGIYNSDRPCDMCGYEPK